MPSSHPAKASTAARAFDIACIFVIAIAAPALAARAALGPIDPASSVAVVYAPWTTAHDAVQRATEAGATLLGSGAFDFVAIVKPESAAFRERALANGAWLLLDPTNAIFCAPTLRSERLQS